MDVEPFVRFDKNAVTIPHSYKGMALMMMMMLLWITYDIEEICISKADREKEIHTNPYDMKKSIANSWLFVC